MVTEDQVFESLSTVYDPELHMPITEIGLVYGIEVSGSKVDVKVTLTSMGCPLAGTIIDMCREAVLRNEGVDEVNIEIVWDPPWSIDMMSDEARMRLGMF
jgi:metal-sulfur cluster biosynthetic enzyme